MKANVVSSPPRRLLLATDFSARNDRALDRAKQLARDWGAGLALATAPGAAEAPADTLEWLDTRANDSGEPAFRQARMEFRGSKLDVTVYVAPGDVASVALQLAQALNSELVITDGTPCGTVGEFFLGTNAQRLSRSLAQPLLAVRSRVRSAYRRIVVATDFSAGSRHVLETAVRLFPEHVLVLYHVHRHPYSGLAGDPQAAQLAGERAARRECNVFLAGCALSASSRRRLRVVIEHASLIAGLARFVRSNEVDLVVLGSPGRAALARALLHSDADSLLHWLPCDTLTVPNSKLATG